MSARRPALQAFLAEMDGLDEYQKQIQRTSPPGYGYAYTAVAAFRLARADLAEFAAMETAGVKPLGPAPITRADAIALAKKTYDDAIAYNEQFPYEPQADPWEHIAQAFELYLCGMEEHMRWSRKLANALCATCKAPLHMCACDGLPLDPDPPQK